jgi:hypothetical protein
MIDQRVDQMVAQAHRLVKATEDSNNEVIDLCNKKIREERFWISLSCLIIISIIVILSFLI